MSAMIYSIIFLYVTSAFLSDHGTVLATRSQATETETVSGVRTGESSAYSAVKVSITPSSSTTFRSFRFTPASDSIEEPVLLPASSNGTQSRKVLMQSVEKAPISDDVLRKLPDWSVWADRSVIILTITHLSLTRLDTTCPKMSICAVPGMAPFDTHAMDITQYHCRAPFSEISGTCHDNFSDEESYSLFPLASSIHVMVNPVGVSPSTLNSSMDFVVTAGYRLPPGVFRCPLGLFPCPLTAHRLREYPPSSVDWQQRICLPASLCCDGVSNCPESGFDEKDCDGSCFSHGNSFPPVAGEKEKVDEYLCRFDCNTLRRIGHECVLTAATTVYLLVALGVLVLSCALVAVVLCIIRKSKLVSQSFRIPEKSVELQSPSRCSSSVSMEKQKELLLPSAPIGDKQHSDHLETCTADYLLDGLERKDFRPLSS